MRAAGTLELIQGSMSPEKVARQAPILAGFHRVVDGALIGVGVKRDATMGKFMKVEFIYTDYEDISLTSSVARTGVSTNNKVTADLDTTAIKFSYAF